MSPELLLLLEIQVAPWAGNAYRQLTLIGQRCPLLGNNNCAMATQASVTSSLDYCHVISGYCLWSQNRTQVHCRAQIQFQDSIHYVINYVVLYTLKCYFFYNPNIIEPLFSGGRTGGGGLGSTVMCL